MASALYSDGISTAAQVTKIPKSLKKLTWLISSMFYDVEHTVVIDYLIHHACMTEDDLSDLLNLEKKHLRALLNQLKCDKLVKKQIRVSTDAQTGRANQSVFYYIDYRIVANVVRYKLDKMRQKLEIEETSASTRAAFKCTSCESVYSDLEVDKLFDALTRELLCTYCGAEVEENAYKNKSKREARQMMLLFNKQFEDIYQLLKRTENYSFPTSTSLFLSMPGMQASQSGANPGQSALRTAGTSSKEFNLYEEGNEREITVNIINPDDVITHPFLAPTKQPVAESEESDANIPSWLKESCVESRKVSTSTPVNHHANTSSSLSTAVANVDNIIMKTLLIHESKTKPVDNAPANINSNAPQATQTFVASLTSNGSAGGAKESIKSPKCFVDQREQGCEFEFCEEESEEQPVIWIKRCGKKLRLSQIDSHWLGQMSEDEKNEYIALSQDFYSDHFY